MNTARVKSTTNYDVLTIGGGLIGMLTARALHMQDLDVAIVEKYQLGKEATWAAGGILSPLYPWKHSQPFLTLTKEGQQHFPILTEELKQETSIDSELITSGMILLDQDEKEQALNWANKNNELISILNQQELITLEPNCTRCAKEAIYLPSVRQVRPPLLIKAIEQSLKINSIDVFENCAVKNLIIESNCVQGIETDQGKLYANKIVLCTGAWTPTFIQSQIAKSVDISPVRGQMILYKTNEKLLSHIILKQGSYLIPRNDGHLLCGSTIEHVGFNKSISHEAGEMLTSFAEEMCPTLKSYTPIKQWAALRPGTTRDSPYICEHPNLNGLYFNCGHYRYGILMSIASARLMTELIANTINPSQIAPYSYQIINQLS